MEERRTFVDERALMAEVKKIMVAVDDSELSHYAQQWALNNRHLYGSAVSLVIFHAQPVVAFNTAAPMGITTPGLIETILVQQKQVSQAILSHAKEICAQENDMDSERAGKTMKGKACVNFSENLPAHSSCATGFSQRVDVDLRLRAREDGNLVTSEGCLGILNMLIWRFVAKWGQMKVAYKVFEKSPERDVIDWNALLSGYVKNGRVNDALELFWAMPERNVVSWTTMITGYAQKGCMDKALELFQRMPERNVVSWTAMVAGYARSGLVGEAMELFLEMPERNVVTWTAMIAGYVQNGCFEEALELFWQMKMTDVEADSETLASILPACANLAALEQGREVHEEIIRSGFQANVFTGSALVDMYAKCGSIEDAHKVFDRVHEKNIVLWNAMIAGYAMHSCSKEALQLFGQMQNCSTKPDHLTFLSVLSACGHAGLVNDGWQYFKDMNEDYGIVPGIDHYSCMVDLLGRAGLLNEAEDFINKMPIKPYACVWEPLLGACRIHNNIELGERVACCLFELDPTNAAHYVLLSNMYAAVGRWDGIEKVRNMMRDRNVKKLPGCSWIEVNNKVYSFLTGDKIQSHMQDVKTKLDECSVGR